MKNAVKYFFGCALVMTMYSFTSTNAAQPPRTKITSSCVINGMPGTQFICVKNMGTPYCTANDLLYANQCIPNG